MKPRGVAAIFVAFALAASALALSVGTAGAATPVGRSAPYEYLGWGSPQAPTAVMAATGIRTFTLAFMLSKPKCDPAWDGKRPLAGGSDQTAINSIRAAGGDVVVSFGGWSGSKLGQRCTTATALAGAYQKVIDAYALKAIDIDIEHGEIAAAKVRTRVITALAAVHQANPALEIYVTFGTTPIGPDARGSDLIVRAASIGFMPTAWTLMPFDFGSASTHVADASITALEGLNQNLRTAYGITAANVYAHSGISSMNGVTDDREHVSVADFQTLLEFLSGAPSGPVHVLVGEPGPGVPEAEHDLGLL